MGEFGSMIMTRRNIFRAACLAVAVSAMEVCGMATRPVSMRRTSDLICVHDIRSATLYAGYVKKCINDLWDNLPKDQKFHLVWVNEYDAKLNPYQSRGYFLAVPRKEDGGGHVTIDESGFLADLTRRP